MTENELAKAILGPAELTMFERLYREHGDDAWHTARAFLPDAALAADAVHNAFLEILRFLVRGNRMADNAEERAMVLRNTRWAALKMLRAKRSRPEVTLAAASSEPASDVEWIRSEARALCEQIVSELPPTQRAVLHAHYVEQMPDADAARALGLSYGAYRQRLNRALRAARRLARGQSVMGVVGWIATLTQRSGTRQVKRAAASRHASPAKLFVAGGVVATIAVAGLRLLGPNARQPADIAAPRVSSSVPAPEFVAFLPEVPEDARIVAVAERGGPADLTLSALGRGEACDCWVLFQSTNDGATWDTRAGPSSGLSESEAVRTEFALDGPEPDEVLPRSPCAFDLGHVVCGGRRIDGMASSELVSPGVTVAASRDLALYLSPADGILCSTDGGTWRLRCD